MVWGFVRAAIENIQFTKEKKTLSANEAGQLNSSYVFSLAFVSRNFMTSLITSLNWTHYSHVHLLIECSTKLNHLLKKTDIVLFFSVQQLLCNTKFVEARNFLLAMTIQLD